jgi:SAM-dependent methyltransferase
VERVGEPGFGSLRIYEPGIGGPFRPIWSGACDYRMSFWWPDVAPGSERDGIPCQDLEALTFAAESFDAVVTSDVLEHVRKPMAAFREIARVLVPGGVHVFSVPTGFPLRKTSVARVDTSGATDVHRSKPLYHGDGAGGRALVYTDFGEDLLIDLAELGFDTELHVHRPSAEVDPAVTFVSRKRIA